MHVRVLAMLAILLGVGGDSAAPPADFQVKIAVYAVGKRPAETAQLFTHEGRVYQFRTHSKEVVIVDPGKARIDLVDFAANRRVRTSVTFQGLDEAVKKLRQSLAASAERREKEGGKANLIAARMTRDLIDPKLAMTFDASAHRLRLEGTSATAEATGATDPDVARLDLLAQALIALAKLEWIRLPEDIPPFTRLIVYRELIEKKRLRPTELVFVYQLAGPPEKFRWVLELEPELGRSELEAVARIDRFKPQATYLGFARYEKLGKH